MKRLPIFVIAFFISFTFSAIVYADLNDGLVAYLPFDGNADDISGNGNNGIVYGATLTEDRFGNIDSAYLFDGIDDYIVITHNASLNFSKSDQFTLSAWINFGEPIVQDPTQSAAQSIFGKRGAAYEGYNLKINETGTIEGGFYDGEQFRRTMTGSYPWNEWHLITVTHDGTTVRSYMDGVLIESNSDALTNPVTHGYDLLIGRYGSEWHWHMEHANGIIDDARIYNRALSSTEIKELYGEDLPNYPEGMISYWKFEEGTGPDATDSLGANDGTIKEGAAWTTGQVGGALEGNYYGYVEIPDHSSLNPDVITVEAWVYPRPCSGYRCFVAKNYGSGWSWPYTTYFLEDPCWNNSDATFSVTIGNSRYYVRSPVDPISNQWSHLVGTYDGSIMRIYINGELMAENDAIPAGPIAKSLYPLHIGRIANNPLIGKVDEVAIYNRALTLEEIQQHYQNGLEGKGYEEAPNQPPIAEAGDPQSVHPGDIVTLDGSGSSDPDGHYPLTYFWEVISKPEGSEATLSDPSVVNPTFTADLFGDYIIQLVVTDSLGSSSLIDQVLVSTFNTAPVADAGEDQVIIIIGTLVTLDGTQSWDDEGDTMDYLWSIVSKPIGSLTELDDPNSATPSFSADIHGDYVVQLIVNDPWDVSQPDTVKISFDNVKPVADAGDNQAVLQNEIVYLDGSGSSDANLDPLTFNWSIVTKPEGSLAELSDPVSVNPQFTADVPGEYVISLVTNDGFEDSDPNNITILATTYQSATSQLLEDTVNAINNLEISNFNRRVFKRILTMRINIALRQVDLGNYNVALMILEYRIIPKIDGCASSGSPDTGFPFYERDWIDNCDAQGHVYPLIDEAIELLNAFIN